MFFSLCFFQRILPMVTTMFVATTTVIFAAADFLNTCPILGRSTLHRSCPPPAPCTVSTAPNPVPMTSPTDTQPPQWAEPHTNSSKLPSSSLPSRGEFIPLTPSTVALLTYLLLMATPSPVMLSLLPMRRWMRTTNQIRPARSRAHLASLTPRHKCPPSSPTMAGPRNVCRLMSDRAKKKKKRVKKQWVDNYLSPHVWAD